MKRFIVSYCAGCCGYGWEKEYDEIQHIKKLIRTIERNQSITVYDNKIDKIVYYKEILEDRPFINLLYQFYKI